MFGRNVCKKFNQNVIIVETASETDFRAVLCLSCVIINKAHVYFIHHNSILGGKDMTRRYKTMDGRNEAAAHVSLCVHRGCGHLPDHAVKPDGRLC